MTAADFRNGVHSFPDYTDLRDQSQSFSAMAAFTRTAGTLAQAEDAQHIEGVAITPEVFDVLGVPPLLGRGFTQEEAKNEADRVVVLTYPLWQRAFGGDPKILGQQVNISGRSSTVIGVMPQGWKFPVADEKIDYVMPLQYLVASALNNRGAHFLSVVGRLKPGVQMRQAEAELSAIAGRLSKQYPDTNMNFTGMAVVTLHSDVVGNVRPALVRSPRRGRARPSHRLRERGQSPSGARRRRAAARSRSAPRSARAAARSCGNCFAKACSWR